jgi:hypothetical protein
MSRSTVVWAFFVLTIMSGVVRLNGQVNVTTWHNDNWRTGQNTNENVLKKSSFDNRAGFGQLCKISLPSTPQQEEVYSQPLVVANSNGMTVYVATMQDNVYAFNVPNTWTSQTCALLKNTTPVSLLRGPLAGQYPADSCLIGNTTNESTCTRAVCPSVGVLGTPVIDTGSNTMYLVTESQDANTEPEGVSCKGKNVPNFYHYLHALDLTTLAEKNSGPKLIQASQGNATFVSQQLLQRPGLLFLTQTPAPVFYPTVYIGFSMMDGTFPNPSGWVLAYDGGSLLQGGYPLVFATTPGAAPRAPAGGGIWCGGCGLAGRVGLL